MTIDLLAKQGLRKLHPNLAGRNYDEILFKRKELFKMFEANKEERNKREFIAKVKEISYINDSYAINTNITWFSMEQISNKILWIVEDNDGEQDYSSLMAISREKVGALICFGKNIERLKNTFQGIIPMILPVNNIDDAVLLSSAIAKDNDVVLFSSANGKEEDIERRASSYIKAVNNL